MLDNAAKAADGARTSAKSPVVIKKYANRRLYNTETSSYVTLDDLATMVKSERDFVVYDAKSGEDLTHAVLTQIIVEQESRMGGDTMLPIPFLQQLIRFYGGNMQKMVPSYLQFSLANLAKDQDRFTKQFGAAMTPAGAIEAFQEQARKNVAMFEQVMGNAMAVFKPFGMPGSAEAASAESEPGTPAATPAAPVAKARPEVVRTPAREDTKASPQRADDLAEMRAQMAAMQAMIEKLSKQR
jgi:polyhydroxyalkanoate synthesis repressor PhaR